MLTAKDRANALRAIEALRERRVANLRKLKHIYGGWKALSRLLGVTDQYLCQLAGPNPIRNPGERAMRQFESQLKLPQGWLDELHVEH